jgi:predicted nucleic acid-binding protein
VQHFGNGVLLLPIEDPWSTMEAGLTSFEPGLGMVAIELACGVAKSGSSRNREALKMFLASLIILPFDEAARPDYQ